MTASSPPLLPTPAEMIAHLDRFVRGQCRAKQDIAVAVYNHYLSQAWRDREGSDLGRHHILMIGPTGVGKTYLVKTLGDFLGVPVGFASATGLVEAGYKGNSVESIVRNLLEKAGGDPKKAEKGILFVDEIDKIRRGETGGRDVSGEGVQNALLTLLDGQNTKGYEGSGHAAVDTGRILFICTGAFVGLQGIVEKRLGQTKRHIGFHQRENEQIDAIPDRPIYEALCQAETRDLVEFGMIPEFIGRFATVTPLHELARHDLREIVSERTERSALARQTMLARLHGIELQFEPAALDAIAEEAEALGTGARGLHRLIGRAVDPVDHRWPELAADGVNKVVITEACVRTGAAPQLIHGKPVSEPIDAELRRSALSKLPPKPRSSRMNPESAPRRKGQPWTDLSAMTHDQIRESLELIKEKSLDWANTTGSAREWWEKFEEMNQHRPALMHRVAEELQMRKATIVDFYLAYVYSNTDNIQANLHYLDYMMLKGGG